MDQIHFLTELAKLTTFADLREAMTRNEFAAFMTKGLKGLLIDAYRAAAQETTFQEIVTEDTSASDHEEYPSMGELEYPRQTEEKQAFGVLNAGAPDNVKVTNFKYGGIIEITDEAGQDDQTPGKALLKQARDLGPKHMKLKDKVFWSLITSNPTIYDTNAMFSLNHPGYTGGATRSMNDNIYTNVTMSANALATVLGIIAQWEGADAGQDLDVQPQKILCPITLQPTAYGLTRADLLPLAAGAGPLGPAASGGNPGIPSSWKGKLGVVSTYRLDRVSVTDWYVKTNFPSLLYLKREGVEVAQEALNAGKSFENDMMRWRSKERFGRKFCNWRGFLLVS